MLANHLTTVDTAGGRSSSHRVPQRGATTTGSSSRREQEQSRTYPAPPPIPQARKPIMKSGASVGPPKRPKKSDLTDLEQIRLSVDALEKLVWDNGDASGARPEAAAFLKSDPLFRVPAWDMPSKAQQDLSVTQLRAFGRSGLLKYEDPVERPARFLAMTEALALVPSYGLVGKFAVHYGLFCCTVFLLGSPELKARILPKAMRCDLLGCFAMTELGHGSNVRALGTTARYDTSTQEWVLNTPDDASQKFWIGNAGRHAHMTVVWAQLIDGAGKNQGVHCFLVPLRHHSPADPYSPVKDDEEANNSPPNTYPGVHIRCIGHKIGLNGVDNGRIWFHNARIPRENLLSKFGNVAPDGTYSSPIASSTGRFAAQLGQLIVNRVGIAGVAVMVSRYALSNAIRYSFQRVQFGPSRSEEVPIMTYSSHQRRLIRPLARAYAMTTAVNAYKRTMFAHIEATGSVPSTGHVIASALKVYTTWNSVEDCQTGREACGGLGYSSFNRFGPLRNEMDHNLTVEGDNNVLLQQVSKHLLDEFAAKVKRKRDFAAWAFGAAVDNISATMNPAKTWNTNVSHLRSLSWLTELLNWRTEVLTARMAQSVRSDVKACISAEIGRGTPTSDARRKGAHAGWNANLRHGKKLAFAWTEAHALKTFVQTLERPGFARSADSTTQTVMKNVAVLYGLCIVEDDPEFFIGSGAVPRAKFEAVRTEVDILCKELVPCLRSLCDAFAFDEDSLPPIARGDNYLAHYAFWRPIFGGEADPLLDV